ncbi:Ecp14-2 [Fulvia fulva]|uniref:Ecp14-2 n=1 Tax=Passalora fulva TaxID=5499 RepID=A0A1P8YXQ4_PASFU|nr:Ecp14-2 [Fulvia fulva]AQA29293.1 extracellular protein 14-2 [Fulvia fulva]KAK4624865.1 Ecp14-2 [Fulvia fulva]UJO17753.1 Ecp14-2 [Fulvia fulva]
MLSKFMFAGIFAISAFAAVHDVPAKREPAYDPPTCQDGGQLHCCQATFSGSLAPVTLAADLLCYDLTPAVVNCIITDPLTPTNQPEGCVGEYACCQVNTLTPVLGLFCSKPPGDCTGSEGGDPPHCLDLVGGRFRQCSKDEVDQQRADLGLGPLLKPVTGVGCCK